MTRRHPVQGLQRPELERLRDRLREVRLSRGLTYDSAGALIGKSINFLYEMENLKSAVKMDNLQLWASMYGLRVEFQLANFWNFPWPEGELAMLYRMSRPFGAHYMQRLWLVSALRAWRERLGVSPAELSVQMGLSPKTINQWECSATNPFMTRVMTIADMLDTSVTMELFTQEEWIFG